MKTALIVIDFINDIVHPDGKIPSCAYYVTQHNVLNSANLALDWARQQKHLVIQVKVGFDSHYHTQPKQSPIFGQAHLYGALNLDSWGTEFHSQLNVKSDDVIIIKSRISPFYGTALEATLRANGIEHLYICGVSTTWAIQSCVREAHDRDYQVTIISDACGAHTEQEHQESLAMLNRLATLVSSSEL